LRASTQSWTLDPAGDPYDKDMFMNTLLKTGALVISLAALYAMPSGKANASSHWYCYQQYQDCLAYGGDPWLCEVEYYSCRGMQIPAKAISAPGTGRKAD
jgi:hypothetical protein